MRIALLISLIFVALVCAGCKSETQKQDEEDQLMISTPLAFDPTEEYEISRWWSNGKQLLRLDKTAEYALYENQNRYSHPLEHGRWHKQNFAVLWLEPYSELKVDPTRVRVMKTDGKITLKIGKFDPMLSIASPPVVAEDRLLGRWQGSVGTLQLGSDMRYTFAATSTARAGGKAVLSHQGTWSMVNNVPWLKPDAPSIQPIQLKVRSESGRTYLGMGDQEFEPAK